MTQGPVRVIETGVVVMVCVEEVMCDPYCFMLKSYIFSLVPITN